MRVVTIYRKPECAQCDEAEAVVRQVATRRRFRLQKKNILDDPALMEKFQAIVPVICVDGQEIARLRLTAFVLETALTK
jgi:glutaredoxin